MKSGSYACNYLLSSDMTNTPLPEAKVSSYERGYGDFLMQADLDSFRETSYIGSNKQLFFFADLFESDKKTPIFHSPRYMLKNSVEELKNLGVRAEFDCEINFSIFQDNYKKNEKHFDKLKPLTEHSNLYNNLYKNINEEFFKQLKSALKSSNIEFLGFKGDEANGQFRAILGASDAVEFCDNLTLFKLVCLNDLFTNQIYFISIRLLKNWLMIRIRQ